MTKEQCPICFTQLEIKECAPCHDCGHLEVELDDFRKGIHTYEIYDVYEGLKLQLCNFCAVDFGSYKPEYLGLKGQTIGFENFDFVSSVNEPFIQPDKYCPECNRRIQFLNFLVELREKIAD